MTSGGRPVPRAFLSRRAMIWISAVALPIAVALVLVPATVAIASWGDRLAAAVAALVSAASFDYFLTRPYDSFRISRQGDVTTEILFVVVGLLVGELAARGRQHQRAAAEGRHELTRIHDMAERIAGGE